MSEISKGELEALLRMEPDTELKKKLLAMIEPEQAELEKFNTYIQSVVDLMADTFECERVQLSKDLTSIDPRAHSPLFCVRGREISFVMSMDYPEQQRIVIYDPEALYSDAEIRVRKDNPQEAVTLAKVVVDYLNGEVPNV